MTEEDKNFGREPTGARLSVTGRMNVRRVFGDSDAKRPREGIFSAAMALLGRRDGRLAPLGRIAFPVVGSFLCSAVQCLRKIFSNPPSLLNFRANSAPFLEFGRTHETLSSDGLE